MKTPETVRLSIPVSKQAHEVFRRISSGSGVSLGRCMSSWLDDTLEAADYMASKIEEVKRSPGRLSRELTAYAAGLTLASEGVIERMREPKTDLPPRPSNTGGKVSKSAQSRRSNDV